MSLMVSISGIRGIVGTSLTPEIVVKYASAFAEYCGRKPIVIGRDGRVTGKSIGHIVSSTLLQMGCDVVALGVCPTPTIQLAIEKLHASGGISITASHNPIEWNGLKFMSSTGLFLDAEENKRFWGIADRPARAYQPWDKQGKHRAIPEFVDNHIKLILQLPHLDVARIRERGFKVAVDCINGSGGVIVPKLLRELGCSVVEMNCDVSGIFAHTPEPLPENLTDLSRLVQKERADLGIAVDPDADRLVLIDERGIPIGEEYTIANVTKFVLQREAGLKKPGRLTTVVNLSTTRAVDDIAKEFGATVLRTAVGEINVAKKMQETGAVIGGEGSGGVILPNLHLGRDALVGIALTLQHLAEFEGTLSQLKQSLPEYHIAKGKVDVGTLDPDKALERIKIKLTKNGEATTIDGLKIDFADSWVHLRKSNTEPIIRVIAEARSKQKAEELVKTFTQELLA